MVLKCTDYDPRNVEVPDGFSILPFQYGYEKEWAAMEYAIGDFGSIEEAEAYFRETYLQNPELFPNLLFVLNREHEIVGSCIAWQDLQEENRVSSLHWLVVQDQYQGIGLGRALATAVMNYFADKRAFPVYIHTQPWSWKAILLYLTLGFRLQKTDTFSNYENQYEKAMAELRKSVTEEQYGVLQHASDE